MNKKECIPIWKKYNVRLYHKFLKVIGFTKNKTSRNLFKLFQIAFYAIFIIFIINLLLIKTDGDWEFKVGEFGDFFGGILNPILTFLTFMGLLMTIILQQKELQESRKEFRGQKEALEKQQTEMVIQSFDNKFFQMLNLFTISIERLTVKIDGKDYNGNKIFNPLKKDLEKKIQHRISIDTYEKILTSKFNHFINEFIEFNNTYDTTFKYYFLNLFQLLNYIDTDIPNKSEAKKYTNILRAQLSKNELILLAYNAIGVQEFTTNDYQLLVEKYEFFEHLTYDDFHTNSYIIEAIDSILKKYKNNVFGDNTKIIKLINNSR